MEEDQALHILLPYKPLGVFSKTMIMGLWNSRRSTIRICCSSTRKAGMVKFMIPSQFHGIIETSWLALLTVAQVWLWHLDFNVDRYICFSSFSIHLVVLFRYQPFFFFDDLQVLFYRANVTLNLRLVITMIIFMSIAIWEFKHRSLSHRMRDRENCKVYHRV